MKHVKIEAFTIPSIWYKTLKEIWDNGDIFVVGHGSEETETKKLNVTLEILKPEERPLVDDKAPVDMKYVNWYALRYLWVGDKNEEDSTYTYGNRMREPVDQVEEVIKRILSNPYDRQMTIVIRIPEDIQKELEGREHDPPCLTIIDVEVLDNKLNLTCYFRSWDAFAGLPANIAGIQVWSEGLVKYINARSGDTLKLETGKLIFHSKNCHIYKRQYPLIKELFSSKTEKPVKIKIDNMNTK